MTNVGAILSAVLPQVIVVLLLVAAWRDIATRLIPDGLSIGIALAGLVLRLSDGLAPAAISLGLAVGLFLLLLPVAARGALGGGDVKLAAALVLGLSPAAAWDFIVVTVLVGGLLGVAYIAGPFLAGPVRTAPVGAPLLQRILQVEHWRLRRRGPLPYAVAIAAGGIIVLYLQSGG